jgi:hypothetical protein
MQTVKLIDQQVRPVYRDVLWFWMFSFTSPEAFCTVSPMHGVLGDPQAGPASSS